jgi:LssY C-terminus
MKRRLLAVAVCACPFFAGSALAAEVPKGTEIDIRLKSKVSTQGSRTGDPVEAVVIAPVIAAGQFAIPAGATVAGTVEKVSPSTKPEERASMSLSFTEIGIGGTRQKISARLAAVDNAREKVDDQGQINGILASETITSRMDTGIDKIAQKYSGLADLLRAAKSAVLKPPDTDITYNAGVEMTLRLLAPLTLAAGGAGPAGTAGPIPEENALAALVNREPFQTLAKSPPKPSDVTNLMLIGTEDSVRQIFHDAGWTAATSLNSVTKFETLRALAEDRPYDEAPVSILLLDGRPPDLVFEKVNNTFARRHHLRIWLRPETFLGKPVWVVAATHDTGISFSEADRTFIHRIDSQIDRERAKVTTDLLFTSQVDGIELVARPQVPKHGQNATGDNLETDGRMAVLLLR